VVQEHFNNNIVVIYHFIKNGFGNGIKQQEMVSIALIYSTLVMVVVLFGLKLLLLHYMLIKSKLW